MNIQRKFYLGFNETYHSLFLKESSTDVPKHQTSDAKNVDEDVARTARDDMDVVHPTNPIPTDGLANQLNDVLFLKKN